MRTFFAVIMMLLVGVSGASAQRRVSSVSVGAGEGAIASGITGIVTFEKADSSEYGEFAVMQEQAWLAMGKNLHGRKLTGFIAWSVGHYQGSPWVGPYVRLTVPVAKIGSDEIKVSTMQWPAWYPAYEPKSFREDGVENPETLLIGYLGDVSLSYRWVTLGYAKLNFLDLPWNTLPSVALTVPMTEEVSATSSWTRNVNKKADMWYMGLTWVPKKK